MISIKLMLGAAALTLVFGAGAQPVPLSYQASPDVYKLLAEDANFRVILATWPAGQPGSQAARFQSGVMTGPFIVPGWP